LFGKGSYWEFPRITFLIFPISTFGGHLGPISKDTVSSGVSLIGFYFTFREIFSFPVLSLTPFFRKKVVQGRHAGICTCFEESSPFSDVFLYLGSLFNPLKLSGCKGFLGLNLGGALNSWAGRGYFIGATKTVFKTLLVGAPFFFRGSGNIFSPG